MKLSDDDYWERYDNEHNPENEAPKGYCSCCNEYVTAILQDFGIGDYEYWGYKGRDRRLEWVSPCCECKLE